MDFLPLKLALEAMHRSKMRSFLTVFGVLVGIAMVIIVMSAGEGVKSLILGEVASFGDNWIDIEVKVPSTGKASFENAGALSTGVVINSMTYSDMEKIKSIDNIDDAYAGVTTQAVLSYQNELDRSTIFGVTESYSEIDKTKLGNGRFFESAEEISAAEVVVLGSEIKDTLFGNSSAIGETVRVDGKAFRVIGVFEERGASGFINMDKVVFIPLRTVQKKIMGIDHVLFILAQTHDNKKAESTAEEIRSLMREQHSITDPDKDDFSVTTMNEALEMINTVVFGLTVLLVLLSVISLLVGGVGIMNVMYVSVAERTFEIGLRKSVGATEKDIRNQFLVEAIILTFLGGIIGIIFGFLISFLIAFGAQHQGLDWSFKISLSSVFLSTIFCISVGLLFGVFPAKKAAELEPIVALRKE